VTKSKKPKYKITFRERKFFVSLDKVLFFKTLQKLHGRFWGIAAINGMVLGLSVCFLIRPEMLHISTAFSDFGRDVRTAPFFAGSMFFAAYGLWRWRNYLSRTVKRPGPVLALLSLTILGLYIVALMPVSWKPWPYRIHLFGFALAGVSVVLTVVVDGLLTKTKKSKRTYMSRVLRIVSVLLIIIGGYITFGSAEAIGWYRLALLGECLVLLGYIIWVYMKTIQGEGLRSKLSVLLSKIVEIK